MLKMALFHEKSGELMRQFDMQIVQSGRINMQLLWNILADQKLKQNLILLKSLMIEVNFFEIIEEIIQ